MADNQHTIHTTKEAQRYVDIRYNQEQEIRAMEKELWDALELRNNLVKQEPKDIKRIIDLDNWITERAQEFAKATIYIDLT